MKLDIRTILILLAIVGVGILLLLRTPKVDTSQSDKIITDAIARIEKRQMRDSIYELRFDSLSKELSNKDKTIFENYKKINLIYEKLYKTVDNINTLSSDQLVRFYSGQLPKTISR